MNGNIRINCDWLLIFVQRSNYEGRKPDEQREKLINVMVGEIFQLAEMEKLDERSIERLERLGVAALKLRAAIEQGEFENDELSTQMCLAIKEAMVEGEGLVN